MKQPDSRVRTAASAIIIASRRSRRLLLAAVLALAAVRTAASAQVSATPTPKPCHLCGDANGSGGTDIIDALLISQYSVGIRDDPLCLLQSDVNADQHVDIVDALFISQFTVHLRPVLTCPGCGNNTVDPGEACDPPGSACANAQVCSSNCACVTCHDVCVAGAALDPACGACVATVCAADPLCCTNTWDAKCIGEAAQLCAAGCAVCGNSVVEPGEQCDPPSTACAGGGTCNGACICE